MAGLVEDGIKVDLDGPLSYLASHLREGGRGDNAQDWSSIPGFRGRSAQAQSISIERLTLVTAETSSYIPPVTRRQMC